MKSKCPTSIIIDEDIVCNTKNVHDDSIMSYLMTLYVYYHGNNLYTLYGHLTNNVRAYVGMNVNKGTVIGYMGNSGRSYGTHLHFGASRGYPGRGGSSFFDPRSLYK